MAQLNFNAAQVQPDAGIPEPVPAGWYNAQIVESEMKPTKDNTGAYLALTLQILDGQYANRKVFTRLNLRNNNPVAQQIAFGQLSAICHAVQVIQCEDSQQLHGRPLKIKVKLRAASGDYEASNEVSAYKNVNDPTAISAPGVGGAPAMQPQAPAGFGGAPAGFGAPVQQQPAAQPWAAQQPQQQPQMQPAMQPQQQAPVQQPAQAWQQPAAAQPWAQTTMQPQQPVQQQPQQMPPVAPQMQQPVQQPQAPAGFNPQQATPPWQQGPSQ